MGRWYCCNDSFVSLSTLQEVLSEKVYILFFSRTKQRPVPANTAMATNGTKSCNSNGSDTSRIAKAVHPLNSVSTTQFVNHPSEKDNSPTSKVDTVTSSPKIKLGSFGIAGTKKPPANGSVKIVVHKRESSESNGDVKTSNGVEKSESKMPSLKDSNGVCKTKPVDGEKTQSRPFANGNGKSQSIKVNLLVTDGYENNGTTNTMASARGPNHQELQNGKSQSIKINSLVTEQYENNGTRNTMALGRGPNYQELQNGSVNCPSGNSGSKRKLGEKDSSILLAEDAQSRAIVEELKEKYVIPLTLALPNFFL